jgi:hypothetical protein
VIAVRRIDQFAPQRTSTVVATPSCCCCCCCCALSLTYGGVLTEKILTSAIISDHPELSPDQLVNDFGIQRVLLGLAPMAFVVMAAGLAVEISHNSRIPPQALFLVFALWIAAVIGLFFSTGTRSVGAIVKAVLLAPGLFVAEFALAVFTIGIGGLVSFITGIGLAIRAGGQKPGHLKPVTYFSPPGGAPGGWSTYPGSPPAPPTLPEVDPNVPRLRPRDNPGVTEHSD